MSARSPRPTGTRVAYWNEQRATWVGVYDGEEQGLDTDAGRWAIICERHGSILNAQTLALAKFDAKLGPAEWCDECRAAELDDYDNPAVSN